MKKEPLQVWCVSDGRAGIARQCSAIANALSDLTPIIVRELTLGPKGMQVWLPPAIWPDPLAALPAQEKQLLRPPWPDVWIANGRRSIAYSLWVKEKAKAPSLIVQLQNPRIHAGRLDLVVPPRHDRVKGDNVIETLGAPVWFTHLQIAAATSQHCLQPWANGPNVMVILGGHSKRHRFTITRATAILDELRQLNYAGARLLITVSRRTPADVADMFRNFSEATSGTLFFANEAADGPNPYLGWLAQADVALVTEDSTNMITDAAFFGLPVLLLALDGGDAKFDRLHQGFIGAGAARWFSGDINPWTYPPIRDGQKVAAAIVARLADK